MVGELDEVTMFFDTAVNDLCVVATGANASTVASMAAAAKTHGVKRTILFSDKYLLIHSQDRIMDGFYEQRGSTPS
jgi:hypothetical protein